MTRIMLFVFLGFLIVYISACGTMMSSRGGDAEDQKRVAEVSDVAEVPERSYLPRRNPGVQRASGDVYALPATQLKPEAERLPPPVYAISGVKGQEIEESYPLEAVDVIVELPASETFSRGILEGEDVSDWIRNLPEGLTAQAHGVKKGDTSIKIYISGTPAVTMREVIRVNIPGTYLSSGNSRNFVSPTEEESFKSWEAGQTQ